MRDLISLTCCVFVLKFSGHDCCVSRLPTKPCLVLGTKLRLSPLREPIHVSRQVTEDRATKDKFRHFQFPRISLNHKSQCTWITSKSLRKGTLHSPSLPHIWNRVDKTVQSTTLSWMMIKCSEKAQQTGFIFRLTTLQKHAIEVFPNGCEKFCIFS